MIRKLLRSLCSTLGRLARPLLVAGGAALVMLGLSAIALPLVLGITLLAAAQWAAGESEEVTTVEVAAT